jgi:carbon monoxide dehydrogenase subunit G
MATRVDKSITVNVPVETAYNQWTQFEEFPHFMGGISEIRQLDDTRLHWVAEIGGVKREWEAGILEQIPNEKVAWAATEGATNAGAVYFSPAGPGQTNVRLELEYEPEGLVEAVGDKIGIVERRAEADLEKFKSFIEDAGYATGAWRGAVPGSVGTPGVEAAEGSRGDSGKAGVSGKAVAAGVTGAAAAAAGVAAAAKAKSGSATEATGSDVAPATGATEEEVVTPADQPQGSNETAT